jgi:hypothetical protein
MDSEVAFLRQKVCGMISRNAYHDFPGSNYSVTRLLSWLRDFEGLAIEAAQHGHGMAPRAELDAKAADHLLLTNALAFKAVQPEECVAVLAAEFSDAAKID